MNRRSFLRGALAVTAAAVVIPALPTSIVPTIWGDGIHDDTDGLQAALDRKPFICEGSEVSGNDYGIAIVNGRFRILRTLHINRNRTTIAYCYIDATDLPKGHNIIEGVNVSNCNVSGNYCEMRA